MHLGVDHARQDVQALAVDGLSRAGRTQRADRGNAPAANADIAHALAVLVDDGAGFQDRIEALVHQSSRLYRHCEELLRRSNPAFACRPWIASLALAMTW